MRRCQISKRALIVLAICLVLGGGFVAYVWATGCCGAAGELCHGDTEKVDETDCDYYFNVDHDRDTFGEGHTVWVYIKQGDMTAIGYTMNLQTPDPLPVCMEFGKVVTMAASNDYTYWFRCMVGGHECDRDPEGSAVYSLNLDANCDPQ